ncbi:MAG: XkdX family protein [Oscillospiraceae bacterium]|nr:XkdX family protein [Oscillospiraceae bacterium]
MSKALIKKYYNKGLFTEEQLNSFVSAGYITEADKTEIVGAS